MKAGHNGQLFHGQLLGGLLVSVATGALDLGRRAQVLGPREALEAVEERRRRRVGSRARRRRRF